MAQPEDKARENIDRMLTKSGWAVRDQNDAHISAYRGLAIRNFTLKQGHGFAQKITYRTTGKKPEDLIAEFRNSYNPRIAVTVDMIATGTDIKPLEVVLFMRSVKSRSFFEQMKGRGVRVISEDDLKADQRLLIHRRCSRNVVASRLSLLSIMGS